MNITTTRIQKPLQHFAASQTAGTTFADGQGGGVKDSFQAVGQTIVSHPMRSVMNTVNMAGMIGTMSTLGGTSANAKFCGGLSAVLGFGQAVAGVIRGIDALSHMGYSSTDISGQPPRNVGFSAIGDLMTSAGQFALLGGVTTPAAALILGGSALSSAFDYTS